MLWQDRLPANPANAVQVRASRLRAALRSIAREEVAKRVLVSRSGGYELNLDHAGTDVARFEETLSRGSLGSPGSSGDVSALREGLSIWRGRPFSDVPPTPCVEIQVARPEELRLSAMESYADLCLAEENLPATLVAELADEVARSPLRESLQYRLVRALHVTGRSAEALTVYERLRRTLADELGTGPRPELRRLHLEIVAEHGTDTDTDTSGSSAPVTLTPLPEQGHQEQGHPEQGPGARADPGRAAPSRHAAGPGRAAPSRHAAGPGRVAPSRHAAGPGRVAPSRHAAGPGRVAPSRHAAGPGRVAPSRRKVSPLAVAGLACLLGLGGAGGYWLFQDRGRPGEGESVTSGGPQQAPSPERPIPGDSSRLDADVTYPDGSEVKVGERFVKTWKITNTGSVPWRARRLAREPLQPGADGCGSPTSTALPDTDPGQPAVISVSVEARSTPGRCKVYWKMLDEQGVPFMPHLSGIFFDVNVVP